MSTVVVRHYLYGTAQTGVPRRRCTVDLSGAGLWLSNKTGEIIDVDTEESDDTGLVSFTLTPNSEIAGPDSHYTFRIAGTDVARTFIAPVSATPVKLVDCLVDETTLDPTDPNLPSLYLARAERGAVNGVAPLGADGKVPAANLPEASGGSTPDATTVSKGVVQLAGDLGGTAAAPTVPGKISLSLVDAAGDLLVGSGDNTVARLAKGSNGQVLGVSGGAVAWVDPAVTGLEVDPAAARYGCLALTMHPHDISWVSPQFIALTSGRHYMYWVPLLAGTLVTGVRLPIQTAGAGAGALVFGVYQDDNSLLGTTGDVAAQFTGAVGQTWQQAPLTAAAASTGAGVWITALSTLDTGPSVVFSDTDGTNPLPEWLLNPSSHRTALYRNGVAALPATLVPATATTYIDFAIGIY